MKDIKPGLPARCFRQVRQRLLQERITLFDVDFVDF